MTDDDLRARLAELIDDSAPPVTLDEVRARRAAAPSVAPVRRRRATLVVVAALLAGAIALVAVLRVDRTSTPKVTTPASTEPATTATTTVTTQLPVAALPKFSASDVQNFPLPGSLQVVQAVPAAGSLWMAGSYICTSTCSGLSRLDLADGSVDEVRGVPGGAIGLAAGDDAVFVLSDQLDGGPYRVTRIDIPSYRVRYTVDVPDTHVFGNTNPRGRIAFGLGAVWVYEGDDYVARLEPETGRQIARIKLPPNTAANGLAVSAHGLFGIGFGSTLVWRIDPTTNKAVVATNFGPGFAQSIAADGDFVWTTNVVRVLDLYRVDVSRPGLEDQATTNIPTADVAAGDGAVWFLGWEPGDKTADPRNHFGLVGRVDPATLRVVGVTELPIGVLDETLLTVGDGAAWVVDSSTHRAWRIGTG